MEPIVEHEPRLGGVRTRAIELDGEGPPLLLLHGFADSADCWRPVLHDSRSGKPPLLDGAPRLP